MRVIRYINQEQIDWDKVVASHYDNQTILSLLKTVEETISEETASQYS